MAKIKVDFELVGLSQHQGLLLSIKVSDPIFISLSAPGPESIQSLDVRVTENGEVIGCVPVEAAAKLNGASCWGACVRSVKRDAAAGGQVAALLIRVESAPSGEGVMLACSHITQTQPSFGESCKHAQLRQLLICAVSKQTTHTYIYVQAEIVYLCAWFIQVGNLCP